MDTRPANGTGPTSPAPPPPASPTRSVDRTPPHHLDAEAAVLGAALLSRPALAEVVELLKPDDFYRSAHRLVFEAILELFAKGEVIDPITVVDRLASSGKIDDVGGASAIHDLVATVPTAANAVYHARIVAEKAMLRRLIDAGTGVVKLGFSGGDDVNLAIDRAEQLIYDVAQGRVGAEYSPLKELLSEGFERIEQRFENRSEVTGLPTGFNDLDRLTAGLQPQNLVIIAARPAMGKCAAGSTRVVDPVTGAVNTIADVVETSGHGGASQVLSLAPTSKLVPAAPTEYHDNGVQQTFTLRTRLGRRIRVTGNHPFLTPDGWQPLEQLTPGGLVAVPRIVDVFGSEELRPGEAALLGYFLGDGTMVGRTPAVTSASPAIIAELRRLAALFDTELTVSAEAGSKAGTYRFRRASHVATAADVAVLANVSAPTVATVRNQPDRVATATRQRVMTAIDHFSYTGKPANGVREMLDGHGIWGLGAHDKFVPEAVFRAPRHDVATFLSRLFACDGSAWVSGHYYGISYSSVSHPLIDDVQHLLLRFGINAYVREKWVKYDGSRRLAYELEIRDAEQIRRFVTEIGIYSKEDQCADIMSAAEGKRRHTNVDLLPRHIWDLILSEKGDRPWADVSEAAGRPRTCNWHVGKRRPSRALVAELAEALDSEPLRQAGGSDIYWDQIESIEPHGIERVYDVTIPDLHNFVANDIVVHNSSLSLGMTQYVAVELRKPAIIFSLEMSKAEIVDRILSSEARIDSSKIRTGRLDDADWASLSDAMGRLADSPLFIDDTAAITLMEIRSKCRRLKQRHGLELVVVDYLQLMSGHRRSENRQQEVSEISRGMKMLAKELDVPVIALSQLSRQPESRTDKRPQLADLRESGSIEQDADLVGFIYRDEVYDAESPDRGVAELIIAKHRNGPTGVVKLAFLDHLTKFANLAHTTV